MHIKFIVLAFALCASPIAGFSGYAASAVDLGRPASALPYDPYIGPVKKVLTHLSARENSMDRVRHLMHTGRAFRYSFTTPYVAASPSETATRRAGDCKAKALWLADQLNDRSVRFVIGKARRSSQMSHAWLLWQHDSRWWVLDCTNNWEPVAADSLPSNRYIPYYSYARTGEYRHHATETMVAAAGSQGGGMIASNTPH